MVNYRKSYHAGLDGEIRPSSPAPKKKKDLYMWKKIHDEQQNKNLHKKRVFEKHAPLPKITGLAEHSLNYDPLLGFPFLFLFFVFGKRFYELQQLPVMFVFYLFFSLSPKIFISFSVFLHSFLYLFLPTIDGHLERLILRARTFVLVSLQRGLKYA